MAKEHDHSYKLLFSHADMVKDLLLGFVPQDWLDGLDFDSLTKGNNHYVTDDLREREGDVVWKIRWRHGQKQEWKEEAIREGLEEGKLKGKREGRIEGRLEGEQKGRHQGEVTVLLRLLELKFGPVTDDMRQRIMTADSDTILTWSERILTAQTPEEVVG